MALRQVTLRPATLDDADLLLAWANDPATRAASFSSRPILRAEHIAWLAGRLADPGCEIWIGLTMDESRPIGVVRFERDAAGIAVVSIAVATEARGEGLGAELLRSGLAAARDTLGPPAFRAVVRVANEPSIRLFEAAGFRQRPGDRVDRLEFELAGDEARPGDDIRGS
jgi:RimJ/RimL family protein N-acetyltransferase